MTSEKTQTSRLFVTSVIEGRTEYDEVILVLKVYGECYKLKEQTKSWRTLCPQQLI